MIFSHAYQKQVKQDIDSNIWPFTCFNPIGHEYPIQSVGCLNLIEISFEEIRCDYYLLKAVCADSKLVHVRDNNYRMYRCIWQKL